MSGRSPNYHEAHRMLAGVMTGSTHPDGSPVVRSDEPETLAAAMAYGLLALADEVHQLIEAVKLVPGAMP